MQNVLKNFVKEMLTHKDLKGIDPEVVDQLVTDLVENLNTQINRAIVSKLPEASLKDFESLLEKKASKHQIDKLFEDNNVDTTDVATEVMQTFRKGYLGA